MKSDSARKLHPNNVSPPTRGAWIEMLEVVIRPFCVAVAPHTGGVD